MLDLDPANLRDWMATVGLLRLVSETTSDGRLAWQLVQSRYRLGLHGVPPDLALRCERWVEENRGSWDFSGRRNVGDFDVAAWGAAAAQAEGLAASLWCAIASNGTNGNLKASTLEYGHGGGRTDWLASMRGYLAGPAVTAMQFERILAGGRDDGMKGVNCRWDHASERDHAYRAKAPTKDKQTQDQTINALAAIGLASFPSAPTRRGLITALVLDGRGNLSWPVWLDPLRISDLEAALCSGWSWPTMHGRRWLSGRLYCFARGELRES